MAILDFLKKKTKVKLEVIQGDITKLKFPCIVNAANVHLIKGGGVCGAIYAAAGPMLEEETDLIPQIETGQAVLTLGYKVSEYIIHAVGPIYQPEIPIEEQNLLLINAYENALDLANQFAVEEIAFPLISTGIYGYPKEEAIQVAVNTIKEHLQSNKKTSIKRIAIVCFLDEDFEITKKYNK